MLAEILFQKNIKTSVKPQHRASSLVIIQSSSNGPVEAYIEFVKCTLKMF